MSEAAESLGAQKDEVSSQNGSWVDPSEIEKDLASDKDKKSDKSD